VNCSITALEIDSSGKVRYLVALFHLWRIFLLWQARPHVADICGIICYTLEFAASFTGVIVLI
jgi:hypothetical protein